VLTRADADDPAHVSAIDGAAVVVLTDGSAMHLRSVLTGSPVWDSIRRAHERGALMIGCGAGAMVLGDPMLDPRGGAFMIGLGLVSHTAIVTDVDRASDERRRRTRKMAGDRIRLVEVDAGAAVIVR
jgi:cyanophycinase